MNFTANGITQLTRVENGESGQLISTDPLVDLLTVYFESLTSLQNPYGALLVELITSRNALANWIGVNGF